MSWRWRSWTMTPKKTRTCEGIAQPVLFGSCQSVLVHPTLLYRCECVLPLLSPCMCVKQRKKNACFNVNQAKICSCTQKQVNSARIAVLTAGRKSRAHTHIHTHKRTHARTQAHTHTLTHAHMHTHKNMHTVTLCSGSSRRVRT